MDMMADGVITLDDRPAVAAVGRANAALDEHGKRTKTILDRSGKEWQVFGETVVRIHDRNKSSIESNVRAVERLAQTWGKSGVERLIAQRDQMIQRLGSEEAAVKRVTAAYDKM